MMKLSISVLVFLLAASAALAQAPPTGQVSGSVVDEESDSPLADASVALFDEEREFVTGTATGADGTFTLERLRPGTYRLRVSFIGYDSHEVDDVVVGQGSSVDLGIIRLSDDAAIVGEVEVEGERELIEQRVDRTVYNVAQQAVTAGGNALETLQTLPSIEVDTDGNLSLRGNQNVAVHINGRPVPVRGAMLAAMLRQIGASSIERVEVLPNPSARHEPDGMSGIINIVLKEGTNRGISGGLTIGGGTAPNAEVSGNVAYQRGKVDAYASYGFRYDEFGMEGTSNRVSILEAGTSTVDQVLLIDNGSMSHLFNGTLDYTLTPKTTVGLNGTLGLRDGRADQLVGYHFEPNAPSAWRSERETAGDVTGFNGDAAIDMRYRIDGEAHQLTSEARFTRNRGERLENFIDQVLAASQAADLTRSTADDLTDEASVKIDYERPIGGISLETGAKANRRHLDNDRVFERLDGGASTVVPGRSGTFLYEEDIIAGYLQASRAFGKLEAQAGLRAEVTSRDIRIGGDATSYDQTYESLYPSAFVMYNVEPGTSAKMSYSRRVNRPNAMFLNPNPRFEDTLMVDRGNPDLRPEYTNALELTLQYKFLVTVTPFYRHTTDVIRRRMLYDPSDGSATGTFQNLDTQQSYGADISLMPRFGPVRGVLSTSVYRSVTEGGSIETGLASNGMVWSLRGNLQAQLRQGTDLQVFGFYRAPMDVEDGRISAFGLASIGLSQQLMGQRLRLALRVNDVLSTSRFEFNTGNSNFAFHGLRDPKIQQLSATLTYTFGQTNAQRRRNQPQNQQPAMDGGVGF